jgi:3-phosphoinositide dependent protein kinase-1
LERDLSAIKINRVTNDDEKSRKLEKQANENEYHRFVEGNLILKQGLLDKRVVSMLVWHVLV